MTTIPGLIPGTKISFQVQKPKVVRMHSFLDLEEFQSTTKLYGQTIDWPEWFCSPRIGSEQYFKFVDEGVIDPEEVRRAGVILPSRPRNEKLSEMKAVIPEREFFAFSSRARRGGGRQTRSSGPPENVPVEVSDPSDDEEGEVPRTDSSSSRSGGDESVNTQESKEQGVQSHLFSENEERRQHEEALIQATENARRAMLELERLQMQGQAALVAAGEQEPPQHPQPQFLNPGPILEESSPRRESRERDEDRAQQAQGLVMTAQDVALTAQHSAHAHMSPHGENVVQQGMRMVHSGAHVAQHPAQHPHISNTQNG
jgi:hypothetical protein